MFPSVELEHPLVYQGDPWERAELFSSCSDCICSLTYRKGTSLHSARRLHKCRRPKLTGIFGSMSNSFFLSFRLPDRLFFPTSILPVLCINPRNTSLALASSKKDTETWTHRLSSEKYHVVEYL